MGEVGDFERATLCGNFQPGADQIWDCGPKFGLHRDGLYAYGQFFEEDGTRHVLLRKIESNFSTYVFGYHHNGDGAATRADTVTRGRHYAGPVKRRREGGRVVFDSRREHSEQSARVLSAFPTTGMSMAAGADGIRWVEEGILDLIGTPVGPGMQWYTPYPDGGLLFLSVGHRAEGTVGGHKVRGFLFFDQSYTVGGIAWPYDPQISEKVIRWHTFGNWYADGRVELGHFGYGQGKWGIAMVNDSESGVVHARSDLICEVVARDAHGYLPQRIETSVGSEQWVWTADADGAMPDFLRPHNPNSTGTERRVGDTRVPLMAMAWGETAPTVGDRRA